LHRLPADYGVPVLIVQHISAAFATAFGDWLDDQIRPRTSYAHHGQSVAAAAGTVVLAPPGRHMVVRDGRVALTADPERHSCRPSIDMLFESMAHTYADTAVGCLLTGMGRDGATGLLALRQAGGLTFAQDEATSVVYGMPREAALLGAAEHILPPDQIGTRLASLSRSPE
jgi:two-component system chemotaxis response regulator CheB